MSCGRANCLAALIATTGAITKYGDPHLQVKAIIDYNEASVILMAHSFPSTIPSSLQILVVIAAIPAQHSDKSMVATV